MSINELINNYQIQTKICANTDFENKSSVKANNKAVSTMYHIIDLLIKNNNGDDFIQFYSLLNEKENGTNLWVSIHLLEKIKLPKNIEIKALSIINKEIKENEDSSYGLKLWLKDWNKTNS